RSDLFSLGIVMWELATGKYLFKRDTLQQTILAISKADIPTPTSVSPECPAALEPIIMKLLALAPESRYPSAADLHSDLEQFRASQSWTSGGREIALMMVKLFPADTEVQLTPIPSIDLVDGGKAPSDPSLDIVETEAVTMDEERSSNLSNPSARARAEGLGLDEDSGEMVPSSAPQPEPETSGGGAGGPADNAFRWLMAAAVVAAILGSIMFWSITT
ncbi:MAG TPA: hypothetical protein VIG99_30240, partial [Myxococcaceae bacterium]